jgi:hypothetical protein
MLSDAEVAQGLKDVRDLAGRAQTLLASDPAGAAAAVEQMYQRWYQFEGTVRKTDKSLYLDMEDALTKIRRGVDQRDTAKIGTGVTDLGAKIGAYLAAHPGGKP